MLLSWMSGIKGTILMLGSLYNLKHRLKQEAKVQTALHMALSISGQSNLAMYKAVAAAYILCENGDI